ncbi:MAG: hypothetical protein QNJ42_00520 [Crocosphaera sp.]|nr:hypothetical protein [Crocosphaera sp.]
MSEILAKITDAEIRHIVRRSYQYVAMYLNFPRTFDLKIAESFI